jgi:hypothetical protein
VMDVRDNKVVFIENDDETPFWLGGLLEKKN